MSISSEISRISGNVADAYTAANAKGATMPVTQNSANLASTIATIPTGGTPGKYQLLDRVKDDSNNPVGTVVGFHTDANGNEYAIVCLDAQFRGSDMQYLSSNVDVTDLSSYGGLFVYGARETATVTCDKILAYATANGLTSTAVSHCRSKTFTIEGTQYAGQLPTMMELLKIFEFMAEVNTADTSASEYYTLTLSGDKTYWSSMQSSGYGWYLYINGKASTGGKTNYYFVTPILELPNA